MHNDDFSRLNKMTIQNCGNSFKLSHRTVNCTDPIYNKILLLIKVLAHVSYTIMSKMITAPDSILCRILGTVQGSLLEASRDCKIFIYERVAFSLFGETSYTQRI